MQFNYSTCSLADVEGLQQEYVQTLTMPLDTYMDTFVFASQFSVITIDGDIAGFFAIHEKHLLTQLYLKQTHVQKAPALFQDLLRRNAVTAALVVTCDKVLYDVALDEFAKIEKLGYFFQDADKNPTVAGVARFGSFRQANADDIPAIINVSGTFFDDLERRVQHQEIFVLLGKDQLLGIGVIEKSRLNSWYVSVGMFVNPTHRREGIGSAIIARLKRWCYDHEFQPIAGCAYENVGSKRTLEKAGLKTQCQLLKIHF